MDHRSWRDKEEQHPFLRVSNLSVSYHRRDQGFTAKHTHALQDISFTINQAQSLSIIGESGAGKSTLGKALVGIEELSHGKAWLDGKKIAGKNLTAQEYKFRRKAVRLITQNPYTALNPMHQVYYPLMRAQRKNSGPTLHLPESFNNLLNAYPHELSGGQKQNISIMRMLISSPQLVIADEPTSMLDASLRINTMNIIKDAQKQFKFSMIYITHDLAGGIYMSNNILVLYAGYIMEYGPAKDIIENPQHPYTQLLKSAHPQTKASTPLPLKNPKGPIQKSTIGCPCVLWCPRAEALCAEEVPKPRFKSTQHLYRCIHPPLPS